MQKRRKGYEMRKTEKKRKKKKKRKHRESIVDKREDNWQVRKKKYNWRHRKNCSRNY